MIDIPDWVLADARRFYARYLTRLPRLDFNNKWQVVLGKLVQFPFRLYSIPLWRSGLKASYLSEISAGRRIRMRIIAPPGKPKGLVVDIHGGGWTAGAPIFDDGLTAPMAADGYVVASLDYGLAPRTPFTEIIEECAAALGWILSAGVRRFEVANVFLHGESAGAHLSLMSAVRCRSMSGFRFLKGLVLFSGCYDLSGTPSVRSASRDTLVLYGPSLAPFLEQITGGLGEEARRDPALSPLYADLHGLPPVLLITGAQDPLHDDSVLLAEKLREQGVSVDLFEVPDAPHGFYLLPIRLADFVNGWARQWMNAKTGTLA